MAYLSRARAWRKVGATVWLMVLAAGLLATSPVDDGYAGGVTWSSPGPEVTLSPADPVRAFAVRMVVPNLADAAEGSEATWSVPLSNLITLRVASQFGASSSAGAAGEAGAPTTPAGTPWITARVRDSSGMILTESTPFLAEWQGSADVAFTGNCQAPDPEGVDPCMLAFTVEFELNRSVTSGASEISWSLDASMNLSGFDEYLVSPVKFQPL